jgi:hypothetical protein
MSLRQASTPIPERGRSTAAQGPNVDVSRPEADLPDLVVGHCGDALTTLEALQNRMTRRVSAAIESSWGRPARKDRGAAADPARTRAPQRGRPRAVGRWVTALAYAREGELCQHI